MASVDHRNTAVIAVDGSEHAKFAFDWYVKQLHSENNRVIIVHCVDLNDVLYEQRWYETQYSFDVGVVFKMIEDEKKKVTEKEEQFEKLLHEAKLDGIIRSVHCAIPGEGICQVAREANADFIVIGSRGLGRLRRTLVGSVSDYVVHHANVPVFVCRHK